MNAISIGPLVLDGARFAAVVAFALFFVLAEVAARAKGRDAARWPIIAALVWVLAARAGFVLANRSSFASHPLDALNLWQGGFLPAAGWVAGAALLLFMLFRRVHGAGLALVLGGAVAFLAHQAVIAALPRPVLSVPDIQLLTVDGKAVQLARRGRPLVLNLWATWCPPCRREMPMMVDLAANSPGIDFAFVNQGDDLRRITGFLAAEGLPGQGMISDPQSRLMGKLGAIGLPSTLIFDAQGRLVASHMGEISRAALTRMIAQAAMTAQLR